MSCMEHDHRKETVKASLQEFPSSSGVYLMKDRTGRILYIGKAKDLKKRVSSYFTGNRDIKTRMLVAKIDAVEYIATGNEYEALLLENNLIKKWKPHYNISLKDNKSYPVIRITAEAFPRVFKTRHMPQDGSEYFGPYADVSKIDLYLELIEKLYPLRKCRGRLKKRYAPCLYYHIGRCSAPCAGKVTREEYQETVEQVRRLLRGGTQELLSSLRQRMKEAAEQRQFEEAAKLRDAVIAVESSTTGQGVEDFLQHTRDYVACAMADQVVSIAVFQMREGKLIGREIHRGEFLGDEQEALVNFIGQYYREAEDVPEVLYLSHEADPQLLEQLLAEITGVKTAVKQPKRGRHLRIMKMASHNAAMDADKRRKAQDNSEALRELQEVLELERFPERIEGFDISHLSGTSPVASMVSFYKGVPDKQSYRRFHVKTLQGRIDDYEAMREVTARRYTRSVNEGQPLPDLILIDGGKGQVNAVKGVLNALGLGDLPVIGLAKEYEEIWFPEASGPVRLPEASDALRVLQAVRDETHRFAVSFQKQLRRKNAAFSLLEAVPGIGPKRSEGLMKRFGSLQALKSATVEQLMEQGGLSRRLAEGIVSVLKEEE